MKLTYFGTDDTLSELPKLMKNILMLPNDWVDVNISKDEITDTIISHFIDDNKRNQFIIIQESGEIYTDLYKRLLFYQGLLNFYRIPYVVFYDGHMLPKKSFGEISYDILLDKSKIVNISKELYNVDDISVKLFEHIMENQLIIWDHPLNIYNQLKCLPTLTEMN